MIAYAWKPLFSLHSFAGVGALVFLSFCGSVGQDACAQAPTPTTASAQKATLSAADLFSKDLEVLSKRLGVAFVAEGQPYPQPKSGAAPTLSENLSQADAIREVADYFDYSAVRQGKIYLLTKRYTNPEDLPDVTPEECWLGLNTILKILAPFNPNYPPETAVSYPPARIAHMLSPEQLERLGKGGLPVSELTPEQHEEVWKVALHSYIQTDMMGMEQDARQLEIRHPKDPVFHWQKLMQMDVFGYDMRVLNENKVGFVPVSNTNPAAINPNLGPGPDPTDPSALSDAMKQFLDDKARSSHAPTLSEAVTTLNGRSANHVVYKVDAMYATKHVTLVGTDKLPESTLLHALASVYGLHVVQKEDGSIVLTHPSIIEAQRLSDLGRALQSAIPAPIFRAFQGAKILLEQERQARILANGDPSPRPLGRGKGPNMSVTAMRIFRYLAQTQVKSQPGGKVALSHLGERARNMFEFAPLVPIYIDAFSKADGPLPGYITHFDQVVLTGGISRVPDGATRFSLIIDYVDKETGMSIGAAGFSGAKVPPIDP